MVDSGAKNSVIRADLIRERSVFDIKVVSKTWRSLDFQVLPLIGETNLIVRFDGAVTDLGQVLVMEKAIYPMVLGMDWIERAGAVICVKHGVAIVEVTHGREKEKEVLNSVAPKVEETHQISTTNMTDHKENVAERTPNLGKSEYERTVDNLLVMGALVEGEEMTADVIRNEQDLRIKLKPKERIVASSVQFVKVMSPGRRDGTWQIGTTRSTRSEKEWVTPGCLVESYGGKMLIPVVNLGAKTVNVRGPWKASVVLTDQVFEVNEEEPSTVGSLQPEGGAQEVGRQYSERSKYRPGFKRRRAKGVDGSDQTTLALFSREKGAHKASRASHRNGNFEPSPFVTVPGERSRKPSDPKTSPENVRRRDNHLIT